MTATSQVVFSNNTSAIVTGGGTNAPVGGTTENWTVSSSIGFPSSMTSGINQFHIADPVLTTEKVLVNSITSGVWSVTRGDESTTPVAHAPSFVIQQVMTAGELTNFPGRLLATASYGPATQVTYNANATLTIMDGTNLTVAFTVPTSGNVDVVVSADWEYSSTGLVTATDLFMGIVKHGTVGTIYGLKSWFGNNSTLTCGANSTVRYNLTGLAPGALQIDLAMGLNQVTGINYAGFLAESFGNALSSDPTNPVFIQVFAA